MRRPYEKKNRGILKPDGRLLEACQALRHYVEHPNESSDILLQGGIYRAKDPTAIQTVKVDGVEIGYMVKPCSLLVMNPYFDRYVYVKVPGYTLDDLSPKEGEAILTAVMEAFLAPQQGKVRVHIIARDAMLYAQRFMIALMVERNPNLVSKVGGVNLKDGVVIN